VKSENLLDGFFQKFNTVMMDTLQLEAQLKQLRSANARLRSVAHDYLKGVSLTDDSLDGANPLFVVNGKSSIRRGVASMVASSGPTIVDGTQSIRSSQLLKLGVQRPVGET